MLGAGYALFFFVPVIAQFLTAGAGSRPVCKISIEEFFKTDDAVALSRLEIGIFNIPALCPTGNTLRGSKILGKEHQDGRNCQNAEYADDD
ncbi:hypothetical protein SDC9_92862 [bioreactor metagenome]|uniref:Uncharacterized protein n=1 Tax=bioreactor metagenome TaxID=1076179 RepID=A0A645A8V1_9ZZZZ